MPVADLVSTREATEHDLDRTATIDAAAFVGLRDERGGRWLLDHDSDQASATERHQAALAAAERCLVVGCIDDVVVGYAVASLSATVDGQLCMIDELVVHPEARAIGVGSAMLERVHAWAVENDCQAIESFVLPGNRAAKNFFERVGMKTRKMRVSADIEARSAD